MKTYRVRYSLWRVNANSAEEANKKLCDLLRSSPETYVSVEEDVSNVPFLKRLWTGK